MESIYAHLWMFQRHLIRKLTFKTSLDFEWTWTYIFKWLNFPHSDFDVTVTLISLLYPTVLQAKLAFLRELRKFPQLMLWKNCLLSQKHAIGPT